MALPPERFVLGARFAINILLLAELREVMKFFLVAVFVCLFVPVTTQAQSCLTPDNLKQLEARIETQPPPSLNKKLEQELVKMAINERDLLQEIVSQDQNKT